MPNHQAGSLELGNDIIGWDGLLLCTPTLKDSLLYKLSTSKTSSSAPMTITQMRIRELFEKNMKGREVYYWVLLLMT